MEAQELTRIARIAAAAGAEIALQRQPSIGALVREKSGPRDLVTEADFDAERAIRDVLQAHRPTDTVLGEELGGVTGTTQITWLIDPIDGTTSYAYGREDWAVSVAATDATGVIVSGVVIEPAVRRSTWATRGSGTYVDGRRVRLVPRASLSLALIEINFGNAAQHGNAGAMVETLLPRARDLRRGGSAAASLAHLAAGRADAVWSPGLQPWDAAAGILLVLEAGGEVGDLHGPSDGRWPSTGDVLAAPAQAWEELRDLLWETYQRTPRGEPYPGFPARSST